MTELLSNVISGSVNLADVASNTVRIVAAAPSAALESLIKEVSSLSAGITPAAETAKNALPKILETLAEISPIRP